MTVLYSTVNPAASLPSYYQINSVYVAAAYHTTLCFFIKNGPSWTYLDDVSVTGVDGRELLINGNFENSSYTYTYGSTQGWINANIDVGSNAHTGQHYHKEGTSTGQNVSQTFFTTPGDILRISFWIRWSGGGASVSTKAIIYPS